jgi:quercetin dioxygenase-like cupin family protein
MSKPYTDKIKGRFKTRTFEANTDSHELVWHRDKANRIVTVLEGAGWFFQMDNNIPVKLKEGDVLNIPKMEYHRIYKAGNTNLVLEIEEPKFKSFKEFTNEII